MTDMPQPSLIDTVPSSKLAFFTTERVPPHLLTAPIASGRRVPVRWLRAEGEAKTVMVPHDEAEPEARFPRTPRFLKLDVIGEGAMGIVYRVRDLETDQDVALKTLHDLTYDERYQLRQEFRVRSEINHRNLVELYELIADGDDCFFTMELLEGVHLTEYVRGNRGAPDTTARDRNDCWALSAGAIERLRDALDQLVLGVSALHAAGKVHRDIKPSNVIVTPSGRVVLLDFGLATGFKPEDTGYFDTGEVAGTLAYMAPEQMWGKPRTPAADWYSVGVILYELLTGCLPFEGSFVRMLPQKERLSALAPAQRVASTPDPLDRLHDGPSAARSVQAPRRGRNPQRAARRATA